MAQNITARRCSLAPTELSLDSPVLGATPYLIYSTNNPEKQVQSRYHFYKQGD